MTMIKTRCMRPCKYRKYSMVGEGFPSVFKSGSYITFSVWAVSEKTNVETEHLIYPLSSLVRKKSTFYTSAKLGFLQTRPLDVICQHLSVIVSVCLTPFSQQLSDTPLPL